MKMNGYTLTARAALAEAGYYEKPRPPMKVSQEALARARVSPNGPPSPMAMDEREIYAPYKPMGGVLPEGMALDSCLPSVSGNAMAWSLSAAFHEGQGFFGYPYLAELMQRAEYRHACDIWAEHAVRKWIKINGGTDAKRKAIEEEFKRLRVRDVFQEWMFHDHGFGRGQIFLDFGDADKPNELKAPLLIKANKISPRRPLQRLSVVEPMWSAPGTYATNNPLRHDFYCPSKWYVYGKSVDASRLLTITSRPVSDMLKPAYSFGGQSLVQLMKPYVDNWLRTRQAVSDMVNIYSVLNLKTDMSSTMSGGNGAALYDRADMFVMSRDNRGLMLTDKEGEELQSIAVPLSGLDKLQAQAQEQLASVARIPLSVYLQVTPTGLNATSDGETRNFYADVMSYLEKNVRPALQTVFEIVQLSVLGDIDPTLTFEFLPLWEMSDADKAAIRKSDADADVGYVAAGIVSNEEVRERLSNDETSLYHGVDLTDPPPDEGNDDDDNAKETDK